MTSMRTRASLAVLLVCLISSPVVAQQPLVDGVCFWIDGNNLTVYIDSTSNPDDQDRITTLEIKWEGEGGFVEENCDFDSIFTGDFDVCTAEKIAKVRTRGVGPVWSAGEIIPDGFTGEDAVQTWIVDGSYLTGGTLDKYRLDSPTLCVPEPSALILLTLGTLGLIAAPQRK